MDGKRPVPGGLAPNADVVPENPKAGAGDWPNGAGAWVLPNPNPEAGAGVGLDPKRLPEAGAGAPANIIC